MIDLSKLTPLPLRMVDDRESGSIYVGKENGYPVILSEDENRDDLEFYLLARAAFAIMLERGWTPSPIQRPGQTRWQVRMRNGADMPLAFICDVLDHRGEFADPFTALTEADKWMREQEAKAE